MNSISSNLSISRVPSEKYGGNTMKKKRFISMLICIAMVVTMAPCIVSAADGVAINATNFPDANFKNYVSNTFDT